MLLRVPATAWNPFWTAKGDSLLSGRSSLDDSTTRNLGQLLQELLERSLSESVSESWSLSRNLLFLIVGAMLCFVPTRHRVQQGDAHKRQSSKCAPGLKTQYIQVIKKT